AKSILFTLERLGQKSKSLFAKTGAVKKKIKFLPTVESLQTAVNTTVRNKMKPEPPVDVLTEIQRASGTSDELASKGVFENSSQDEESIENAPNKENVKAKLKNRTSRDKFFN